jgi:hypothetical protein
VQAARVRLCHGFPLADHDDTAASHRGRRRSTGVGVLSVSIRGAWHTAPHVHGSRAGAVRPCYGGKCTRHAFPVPWPPFTPARSSAAAGTIADPVGPARRPAGGTGGSGPFPAADRRGRHARGGGREFVAHHRLSTSAFPTVRSPIGPKCRTLAGRLRHAVSAHRPSARSPSGRRSFATSARAHGLPTSSRASSRDPGEAGRRSPCPRCPLAQADG